MEITLSLAELKAATDAADRFIDENGDCGLAYETILSLCFIKAVAAGHAVHSAQRNPIAEAIARKVTSADAGAVPDWFADGLKQFRGRRLTASQLLTGMGRPTDIKSLRDAGAWLRQMYGQPMRSGGQTLFVIPGEAHEQASGADALEDAFAPGVPLGSKAVAFAIQRQEGQFTPKEIAHMLGYHGNANEVMEIGRALHAQGFPFDAESGRYSMAKVR